MPPRTRQASRARHSPSPLHRSMDECVSRSSSSDSSDRSRSRSRSRSWERSGPHSLSVQDGGDRLCRPAGGGIKPLAEVEETYLALCKAWSWKPDPAVITVLRYPVLKSLTPSWRWSEGDFLAFSQVLPDIPNLRVLHLSHTQPGVNGVAVLSQAILLHGEIGELNLCHSKIDSSAAEMLAPLLKDAHSLKTLLLRGNRIHTHGACTLAKALMENTTLHFLDLSNNNMKIKGTVALSDAMTQRHKLHPSGGCSCGKLRLDLSGNYIVEEIFNSITHGVGLLLSLIGGYFLFQKAFQRTWVHLMSTTIFIVSLVLMYSASTFYHSFFRMARAKKIFSRLDRGMIYFLIAGSYTPFLLVYLYKTWAGSILLLVEWGLCFWGLYLAVTDYHGNITVLLYVLMGWGIAFYPPPFLEAMDSNVLTWLTAGGLAYTGGVYFFLKDEQIPIFHSIWHVFVMLGSLCHYVAVLKYVIDHDIPNLEPSDGLLFVPV